MPKRSRQARREGIQRTLEEHGRFDYDYIPFGRHWKAPDGSYRYRRRADLPSLLCRCALWLFGGLLIRLCYGARVVGRRNLRALKGGGAVCVCNHFHFLDTLFVRQAVGHFRSYHTMSPRNNKTGVCGKLIRSGGMLPFGTARATKNLGEEIARLLARGKIVNFYPEQALWENYQKPRPFKDGAFHYALRSGVPVLPVFCTFQKDRFGHLRRLRIHILPAVYAGEEGTRREKLDKMKEAAALEWRMCYERAYGAPPEYAVREPSAYSGPIEDPMSR